MLTLPQRITLQAASLKHTVTFDYKKAGGEVQKYTTEVYDVYEDRFFGWDLEANKIKSFLFTKMSNLKLGVSFVPRQF
jgi:predicted DNA-binding transcriptional regulator YafY